MIYRKYSYSLYKFQYIYVIEIKSINEKPLNIKIQFFDLSNKKYKYIINSKDLYNLSKNSNHDLFFSINNTKSLN